MNNNSRENIDFKRYTIDERKSGCANNFNDSKRFKIEEKIQKTYRFPKKVNLRVTRCKCKYVTENNKQRKLKL